MTSINRDIRDVNGWGGFGGYWEERLRKLDRQWEQQVPKNATNLFKGLRFWINGLTDPPVSELKQIFLQNGGIMDLVKTPKTDFEIVENLPRAKILRLLSHHQTVKPAFVTDSLKAGKLLDWKNYRLWQDNSGNLFVTKELILDAQFIGKLSCPDTVDESLYSPSEESEDDRLALSEELTLFLKGRKLPKSWDDNISPRKSIGEYYKKSRLHWLSTWRAELAHLVAEMPRTMPAAEVQMGQFIAHIDIGKAYNKIAKVAFNNL
ncbi:unnamed protein product [Oikopleura dioica]|uniref:BRCT domain-containing protein n=1 Tax=Oikopleura dioica TaxID=34765 RepID=E4X4B8_OIKDI|nr:unnamed protein product [Oikopleura dioica]